MSDSINACTCGNQPEFCVDGESAYYQCDQCEMKTGFFESQDAARNAWNSGETQKELKLSECSCGGEPSDQYSGNSCWIECPECEKSSIDSSSLEEAISAWNSGSFEKEVEDE